MTKLNQKVLQIIHNMPQKEFIKKSFSKEVLKIARVSVCYKLNSVF